MSVAKKIELAVQASGLDLTGFAKRAGIPPASLRHYMTGRSAPGWKAILAIARASGMPLDWFAEGELPRRPDPPPADPVLARMVEIWPRLPMTLKRALLAIVEEFLQREPLPKEDP